MMKQRIFLYAALFVLSGSITGCRNADKEIASKVAAIDRDTEQSVELETDKKEETDDGQEKVYDIEEYGTVEERQQEFFEKETGEISYYYRLEQFFVKDAFTNAAAINRTLQQVYDQYEADYIEAADSFGLDEFDEPVPNTPYSDWHLLNLTYAGEDYISILYNDVYYMGGAHPYSRFDGITIDCKTGEQVSASELLGKSDEDILAKISHTMGFDVIGTWDDLDFYMTDSAIVFFYREPGFWEDVVLPREK
ncbi:MAG: DUF4163 domain-containing protein [Clostridiales bacterium]|nr:DUF4163 domain-containing protein [Clostridiales bacterium]